MSPRFSKRAAKAQKIDPEAESVKGPRVSEAEMQNVRYEPEADFKVSSSVMANSIERDIERKRKLDDEKSIEFAKAASAAAVKKKEQEAKANAEKNTVKSLAVEKMTYKSVVVRNIAALNNVGTQAQELVSTSMTTFEKLEGLSEADAQMITDAQGRFKAAVDAWNNTVKEKETELNTRADSTTATAEEFQGYSKAAAAEMKAFLSKDQSKKVVATAANEVRDLVKQTVKTLTAKDNEKLKEKANSETKVTDMYSTKVGKELLPLCRAEAPVLLNVSWTTDELLNGDTDKVKTVVFPAERGCVARDGIAGIEYVQAQKLFMVTAMKPASAKSTGKPYATIPFMKQAPLRVTLKFLSQIDNTINPDTLPAQVSEVKGSPTAAVQNTNNSLLKA